MTTKRNIVTKDVLGVVNPSNPSNLSPLGAAGELLLEGPVLGRGYWEDPVATTNSWICDPDWPEGLGQGRRLYRTKDLVRSRSLSESHIAILSCASDFVKQY